MSVPAMSDPVLYSRNNTWQHRDNQRCLAENIDRMAWREGDRVLDIGSGDGSFTATTLRRFLPDNIKLLVGCDRSESMVKYANQHYQRESIKYRVLEIAKTLPPEFIGSFDHIFSFYALHWIRDQRTAISQIYEMLSDGGECLLLILCSAPSFFDVYRWFAKTAKWSRWVRDMDNVVSPYHDCHDPATKFKNIAEDVGFKDVSVKCKKNIYTFSSVDDFKSMIVAVNPFDIPAELMEEYLEEYVQLTRDKGYLSEDISVSYTYIVAYGRK